MTKVGNQFFTIRLPELSATFNEANGNRIPHHTSIASVYFNMENKDCNLPDVVDDLARDAASKMGVWPSRKQEDIAIFTCKHINCHQRLTQVLFSQSFLSYASYRTSLEASHRIDSVYPISRVKVPFYSEFSRESLTPNNSLRVTAPSK